MMDMMEALSRAKLMNPADSLAVVRIPFLTDHGAPGARYTTIVRPSTHKDKAKEVLTIKISHLVTNRRVVTTHYITVSSKMW
jgi:hypothetical protein